MSDSKFKTRRRYEGRNHARLINFTCYHNRLFLRSARACRWTVDAIERAREKHRFRLWAYCIMPNHVHLLLWPRATVPPILASIKQSVANRAIHWTKENAPAYLEKLRVSRRDGRDEFRFWQRGGGYDRNLWEPTHIWESIDYIHLNPVQAGLCARPEEWEWSSARWFKRERCGPLSVDLETIPSRPA